MINETNWNNIATMIFMGTKWEASEEEIKILAKRLFELEERGLSKLNKRLMEGGKMVWDTFAEHNFCYELIEYHPSDVTVQYEPNELEGKTLKRPPDFVIQKEGLTFLVQMKRLSDTERENRRSNHIKQIKKLAKDIKVNKFFWCDLSEDFNSSDVKPLVEYISKVAADSIKKKKYLYPSRKHIKAEVTFWEPQKAVFEHLTLYGSGQTNCINVTGESSTQIKSSLYNAAGAFEWDTDRKKINLVAMEIGNASHDSIDLGEAVFGGEAFTYSMNGKQGWYRANNGFFYDPDFSSKVAGVIALKRKEHLPLSRYTKLLFINDSFKDMIDQLKLVMNFDRIIQFTELIHDDIDDDEINIDEI